MFLLVGLGNPGIRYAYTRHNAGFWVIDELAYRGKARLKDIKCNAFIAKTVLAGKEVLLAKPLTFMNRSGFAVKALLEHFSLGVGELLVIYDDMDLPPGRIRLRTRGGSGGHRGMASIINQLNSDEFCRLRLGVGRGAGKLQDEIDFLLSPLEPEGEKQMQELVLTAADAVEVFLAGGIEEAMNRYNARFPRLPDRD
ncbi:MAG TPA: aminoacyl-tRNA hydrolase [Firmicutes bacterium]|nr:aminoacyl-tRNA hydrolase [Bacillota bacterium]